MFKFYENYIKTDLSVLVTNSLEIFLQNFQVILLFIHSLFYSKYLFRWPDIGIMVRVFANGSEYQRLKKWYLMPPWLALSIIRYGSRGNPGKGVAPSPTSWCSSYRNGKPSDYLRLRSPTLLISMTTLLLLSVVVAVIVVIVAVSSSSLKSGWQQSS